MLVIALGFDIRNPSKYTKSGLNITKGDLKQHTTVLITWLELAIIELCFNVPVGINILPKNRVVSQIDKHNIHRLKENIFSSVSKFLIDRKVVNNRNSPHQ